MLAMHDQFHVTLFRCLLDKVDGGGVVMGDTRRGTDVDAMEFWEQTLRQISGMLKSKQGGSPHGMCHPSARWDSGLAHFEACVRVLARASLGGFHINITRSMRNILIHIGNVFVYFVCG